MANRLLIAALVAVTLAACGGVQSDSGATSTTSTLGDTTTSLMQGGTVIEEDEITEEQMSLVEQQAIADLAERLDVAEDEIKTLSVASGLWSDASLGCPDSDQMYAQVLTAGVRVILGHGADSYSYHQGGSGEVFLCEEPVEDAFRGVEGDVLIPPPGYND